jgi:small neutral amino acid transporter SnatA (MarC family)
MPFEPTHESIVLFLALGHAILVLRDPSRVVVAFVRLTRVLVRRIQREIVWTRALSAAIYLSAYMLSLLVMSGA